MFTSVLRRAVLSSRPSLYSLRPSSCAPLAFFSSSSSPLFFSFPRLSSPLFADALPSAPATRSAEGEGEGEGEGEAGGVTPPKRSRRRSTAEYTKAKQATVKEIEEAARAKAKKQKEKEKKREAREAAKLAKQKEKQALSRKKKLMKLAANRVKLEEKARARKHRIRERQRVKADAHKAEVEAVRNAKATVRSARPHRPGSAFVLFQAEVLPTLTGSPQERVKAGAERWRGLSEEEKRPYYVRQEQLHTEYKAKMDEYRRTFVDEYRRPKRPLHGYMRFGMERIPTLRAKQPGLRATDYMKQVAAEWKGMGEEERNRWMGRGKDEWDEYARKMIEYKAKPLEQRLVGDLAVQGNKKRRHSPSSTPSP